MLLAFVVPNNQLLSLHFGNEDSSFRFSVRSFVNTHWYCSVDLTVVSCNDKFPLYSHPKRVRWIGNNILWRSFLSWLILPTHWSIMITLESQQARRFEGHLGPYFQWLTLMHNGKKRGHLQSSSIHLRLKPACRKTAGRNIETNPTQSHSVFLSVFFCQVACCCCKP